MAWSQLLEIARLMASTYEPKESPKAPSPNLIPASPAPVENCPYSKAGRPSPYGTALVGGGGVAGAGPFAGCAGFGSGRVLVVLSGIGIAAGSSGFFASGFGFGAGSGSGR